MLRTLKASSTGDIVISNKQLVMIEGEAAAAQIIKQVIQTQLGEYQYAKTKGVDYFGNAFLGNPNFQLFQKQIRTQVGVLSFVEKITAFEYNLNNSILTYSMTVQTIYGTTTISG